MDILGKILGWNWKVKRTRRKWDRLREKSLDKEGRLRKTLLEKLDHTEETLRIIEERNLSRRDRQRSMQTVVSELNYIESLLEGKIVEQEMVYRKEDLNRMRRPQPQQYGSYPYQQKKKK